MGGRGGGGGGTGTEHGQYMDKCRIEIQNIYLNSVFFFFVPTYSVSTRVTSNGNSMMLQFHLTPYQVQAISSSG